MIWKYFSWSIIEMELAGNITNMKKIDEMRLVDVLDYLVIKHWKNKMEETRDRKSMI